MYKLFRIQEREHAVKAMYMAQPKPFCSSRVRAQLVSKMIQADSTLQVPPEVLYLAVNILDRFLSTDPMGDLLMASAFGSPPAANIEAANASLLRLLAVGCFTVSRQNSRHDSSYYVLYHHLILLQLLIRSPSHLLSFLPCVIALYLSLMSTMYVCTPLRIVFRWL